jgi:hypothetical protein
VIDQSREGSDLDCRHIGHEVVIDGSDPNGLDGDGIGCQGWSAARRRLEARTPGRRGNRPTER